MTISVVHVFCVHSFSPEQDTLWEFKVAIENGPVEVVSFPTKNCDFPKYYVSLPEGKPPFSYSFPMIFPFSMGFPLSTQDTTHHAPHIPRHLRPQWIFWKTPSQPHDTIQFTQEAFSNHLVIFMVKAY